MYEMRATNVLLMSWIFTELHTLSTYPTNQGFFICQLAIHRGSLAISQANVKALINNAQRGISKRSQRYVWGYMPTSTFLAHALLGCVYLSKFERKQCNAAFVVQSPFTKVVATEFFTFVFYFLFQNESIVFRFWYFKKCCVKHFGVGKLVNMLKYLLIISQG